MRTRIARAIVGVTAFVVLALSVPLAIVLQRLAVHSEVVELQAVAAHALTEIEVPIDPVQLMSIATEPDAPPPFGVYSSSGDLIFGVGPSIVDPASARALAGTTESSTNEEIVVATAITDENESVVGVLRMAESYDGVNGRSRRAWAVILLADLGAIAVAWLIASRLSRRLAAPVTDLAESARLLGDGAVLENGEPSGIAEIDVLTMTLARTSRRVNEALLRERRFSADVSHQLRTPLSALRLKLEATEASTSPGVLADLARLEATVDHLLTFARGEVPTDSSTSLADVVGAAIERWSDPVGRAGRHLESIIDASCVVSASSAAVAQVLDVLIDNALGHGSGAIVVTVREIGGGGAVDVSDEGSLGDDVNVDRIFDRGVGDNHGIGLDLARSITVAEGGRLVISKRTPTTFSMILLADPAT